jgi:hypothetical protein
MSNEGFYQPKMYDIMLFVALAERHEQTGLMALAERYFRT